MRLLQRLLNHKQAKLFCVFVVGDRRYVTEQHLARLMFCLMSFEDRIASLSAYLKAANDEQRYLRGSISRSTGTCVSTARPVYHTDEYCCRRANVEEHSCIGLSARYGKAILPPE